MSLLDAVVRYQQRRRDGVHTPSTLHEVQSPKNPALQVVCVHCWRGIRCGGSVRPACIAGVCPDGGRIVSCTWSESTDHNTCVAELRAHLAV